MNSSTPHPRTNHTPAGNAARIAEALSLHGPQTRRQLAARLGVDTGTVRSAMERLNEANPSRNGEPAVYGIPIYEAQFPEDVVEKMKRRPGPKPEVLVLGGSSGYVVGVEIGNTQVRTGIGDPNSRLVGEIAVKGHTIGRARPDTTFRQVAESVAKQLTETGIDPSEIRGVTVSVPAPVSAAGRTLSKSVLPTYDGVPIPERLRHALHTTAKLDDDVPVFPENDVDVLARGEQRHGKAFGLRDFAVIKCGVGIGSAIVSNDKVVRGREGGGAGEIGHCPIGPANLVSRPGHIWVDDTEDAVCLCGRPGHLEAFAGGRGIVARLAAMEAANGREPAADSLAKQLGEAVREAAAKKDGLHRRAIEDAGALVGVAANILFHVFNPTRILISGKLAEVGDPFLSAIQTECSSHGNLFGDAMESIELASEVEATEQRTIGIRGAIGTALRKAPPRLRYS